MTGIKILPTPCTLCIEDSNVVLNHCGNKKCACLMCDNCIERLNILPIENRKKCPVCRVKMSECFIKKKNNNV